MKEEQNEKVKRDRSTAYPYIPLEQAIEYSRMLVEAYRKNPFGRLNAVEGIGYTKITGDTAQKIAALGHYGLLERSGNSAYRNTELAQRICYFTSEEQKVTDIATAAQKPKLFRKLIEDHAGQSLPVRLKNILIAPHGITPNVADKVAENFKKTLEYAGLLPNGVVAFPTLDSDDGNSVTTKNPLESRTVATIPSPNPNSQGPKISAGMQSLTLPSGIVISYPVEMAFQFAVGKFAVQIMALEEAIVSTRMKESNMSETDISEDLE